jgi:hypothetical protein
MLGDLPDDVNAILQPAQLGPSRRGEDRRFAILTLIAVPCYILAVVSDASAKVVW